jgi:hypothetical protein
MRKRALPAIPGTTGFDHSFENYLAMLLLITKEQVAKFLASPHVRVNRRKGQVTITDLKAGFDYFNTQVLTEDERSAEIPGTDRRRLRLLFGLNHYQAIDFVAPGKGAVTLTEGALQFQPRRTVEWLWTQMESCNDPWNLGDSEVSQQLRELFQRRPLSRNITNPNCLKTQ